MLLTPHFDLDEFRDHSDGTVVAPPAYFLGCLEHIRGAIGWPLRIVSGYRSPEHNRSVGGAPNSRHLVGDAADLDYGVVPVEVARAAGCTGIGITDGFATHVDARPGPLVEWTY